MPQLPIPYKKNSQPTHTPRNHPPPTLHHRPTTGVTSSVLFLEYPGLLGNGLSPAPPPYPYPPFFPYAASYVAGYFSPNGQPPAAGLTDRIVSDLSAVTASFGAA